MVEFWKYTEKARKIMALARIEAGRLGHDYIESEHILLGLAQEEIAKEILYNQGLDFDRLYWTIVKLPPRKEKIVVTGQMPFTQDTKILLENASKITQEWRDDYIGTEHLFYALIENKESKVCIKLREININLDYIKEAVMDYKRKIRSEREIRPESLKPKSWVFPISALTLEEALEVAKFKLSDHYLDEYARKLREIYRKTESGEFQIVGQLLGRDFNRIRILGNERNYHTLKEFLDNNEIPYEINPMS